MLIVYKVLEEKTPPLVDSPGDWTSLRRSVDWEQIFLTTDIKTAALCEALRPKVRQEKMCKLYYLG